jgi:hypothetical protein
MSPFEQQLAKEARYDVIVASAGIALFFLFGLVLPKSFFWYWFTPLALFWFRYLLVRCRRDDELLRADLAASGRSSAPGCYRSEAGICITDGPHHVLVLRDDADTLLQLPHVRGHK